MQNKEIHVCCICGKVFEGWGNNPYPMAEEGRCCDECNDTYVIPARLIKMVTSVTPTKEAIEAWLRGE